MKFRGLCALSVAAMLATGCAGQFGASAQVSASAEVNVPIADMPPKYASWVVEVEGYLGAVNAAYEMHMRAMADLAAALGVEANADAIARFLRDAIQVETTLICQPPRFNAGVVADCRAEASARAAGNASNGQASGQASAGIQANCQARARIDLSPGKCTLETTVTEHPILSDASRWATIEANMQVVLKLDAANRYLDGRGAELNARGLELHVQSVTDLASDPTLALKLNEIQAELERGAEAAGAANDKQFAMNSDLGTVSGAIDAQFPEMRASVDAQ